MFTQISFANDQLLDSFKKLYEFNNQSMTQMMDLMRSATPVTDMVEVAQQRQELLQNIDWSNVIKNSTNGDLIEKSMTELAEINSSVLEGIGKYPAQMLETSFQASQEYVDNMKKTKEADALIEEQIDSYIDYMTTINDEVGNQAGFLNSVTTAYKSWAQKSMETLSSK